MTRHFSSLLKYNLRCWRNVFKSTQNNISFYFLPFNWSSSVILSRCYKESDSVTRFDWQLSSGKELCESHEIYYNFFFYIRTIVYDIRYIYFFGFINFVTFTIQHSGKTYGNTKTKFHLKILTVYYMFYGHFYAKIGCGSTRG